MSSRSEHWPQTLAIAAGSFALGGFAVYQYTKHEFERKLAEQALRGGRREARKSVLEQATVEPLLDPISRHFNFSKEDLVTMCSDILKAMEVGLAKNGTQLKMLPSYVTRLPTGKEKGDFLALDLGGSNFRVLKITLNGDGTYDIDSHKAVIPDKCMKGSADELFGFIADSVKEFVSKPCRRSGSRVSDPEHDAAALTALPMGFTFSFPVEQDAIDRGSLIRWTKGFSASGTEGKDVVALLQKALHSRDVNVAVTALVNDTVGTLCARALQDQECAAGLILGTGTNAAYVEKMAKVVKMSAGPNPPENMIINTEWGGYHGVALKRTEYDMELDMSTPNPGEQLFEKMVSGMYLGELARLVIIGLSRSEIVFPNHGPSDTLLQKGSFPTALMSQIELDSTPSLTVTRTILERELDVLGSSLADRIMVKMVCVIVSTRAARLAAAGVAAIARKTKRKKISVSVDGSVFKLYPFFKDRMNTALAEFISPEEVVIQLVDATDGSGVGAAAVAATTIGAHRSTPGSPTSKAGK